MATVTACWTPWPTIARTRKSCWPTTRKTGQLRQEIAEALTSLNEKERYIIQQRVSADNPLTLQEIADHFHISRERVRQIEEGALRKMKALLAPRYAMA